MKVLITGGNFVNKGAYLMLASVVKELRERFDACPVMDLRNGDERRKRALGVDTLWTPKVGRKLGRRGPNVIPPSVRGWVPYLMASDVDAVLDISGFRYADQWEHLPLAHSAQYQSYWHRSGAPVVMMPQAFGPFAKTAEPTLLALTSSDLVVPREPESASHVSALLESSGLPASRLPQVMTFSDFTVAMTGRVPAVAAELAGGVAIVPNWNIAERNGPEGRAQYLQTLVDTVERVRAAGLRPYGLSHEGRKDTAILEEVARMVGGMRVVSGLDGLQLKGLLGTARLVVGGRFHALVSSLSQGVPCVVHGWSHKYRWMARDFGVEELCCDPTAGSADTLAGIDRILEDGDLAVTIRSHAEGQKARLGELWDVVGSVLSGAPRPLAATPATV
ncbi:polysaccharide pyruvyl transferase family protein [Cellulomonas bogoriensis]|uniref:Polysaccharide pyruvyl transferase domain-containing protein n=1 Tax=Cellulomonas bogoriensis 69B4 = DSM 16987 TaxID=1386082 RepID=A0A0A0BTG8_9CELL|nr:polysaccharide pyruvyl transferase family protein [Cellulomonas bogoriensis]KGM11211.1 hypothetical protein N869_03300 [Cellulomonas bogoriensis 69B4 = DSM 16987]